jgi:hypothetical protein
MTDQLASQHNLFGTPVLGKMGKVVRRSRLPRGKNVRIRETVMVLRANAMACAHRSIELTFCLRE